MHAFFRGLFPRGTAGVELDCASTGETAWKLVKAASAARRPYTLAFIGSDLEFLTRFLEFDAEAQAVYFRSTPAPGLDELLQIPGCSERLLLLPKQVGAGEIRQLVRVLGQKRDLVRNFSESNHHWRDIEQRYLLETDELETRVNSRTEELTATRQRLEHLLHSSPAVIYSLRLGDPPAFTFVSDNFAALFGHRPAELTGDPGFRARHLHPDDVGQASLDRLQRLQSSHLAADFRFLHQDLALPVGA